jgi:hypothetical protein
MLRIELIGNLGAHNVLNANNVLTINQTYGPQLVEPSAGDGRPSRPDCRQTGLLNCKQTVAAPFR